MTVKLQNNTASTLAVAISNSDLSLIVAAGTGNSFPTLGASEYFYATLQDANGVIEIVKVTARTSDTFTIVRAQEGSTASAFVAGSLVELRVTAQGVYDAVSDEVTAELVSYLDKATYDPTTVAGDAFSMDNMVEGADAKILTATERTNIATAAAGFTNWDAAYGWGDHGAVGYLTDITTQNLGTLSDITLTSIASGEILKWNGSAWINNTLAEASILSTSGGTLTGFLDVNDQELRQPKIKDYSEVVNTLGNVTGSTSIDLTLGNVITATVTGNTTFSFVNPSVAANTSSSFTLILQNGGAFTVTWPSGSPPEVWWGGGSAPTLTVSGYDVITFFTTNGGTTWYGFPAGLNMSV